MSLIDVRKLDYSVGGPLLLEKVEFSLDPGERVCVVGRNGAGKSTLLKLLAGEIRPDDGEVRDSPGVVVARLAQEVPQDTGPGFTINATDTTAGLVLGDGLQVALNDRLALPLEALHYRFSEDELVPAAGRFDPSLDVTTVRAGLSLRFN